MLTSKLQVGFDVSELPSKVGNNVKEMISQYQPSPPEKPRHTIRFMKAPTDDWAEGQGPKEDATEVVTSWEAKGLLVLQINGAATEILERGSIGDEIGFLKS